MSYTRIPVAARLRSSRRAKIHHLTPSGTDRPTGYVKQVHVCVCAYVLPDGSITFKQQPPPSRNLELDTRSSSLPGRNKDHQLVTFKRRRRPALAFSPLPSFLLFFPSCKEREREREREREIDPAAVTEGQSVFVDYRIPGRSLIFSPPPPNCSLTYSAAV